VVILNISDTKQVLFCFLCKEHWCPTTLTSIYSIALLSNICLFFIWELFCAHLCVILLLFYFVNYLQAFSNKLKIASPAGCTGSSRYKIFRQNIIFNGLDYASRANCIDPSNSVLRFCSLKDPVKFKCFQRFSWSHIVFPLQSGLPSFKCTCRNWREVKRSQNKFLFHYHILTTPNMFAEFFLVIKFFCKHIENAPSPTKGGLEFGVLPVIRIYLCRQTNQKRKWNSSWCHFRREKSDGNGQVCGR
jgi:hypothetical protein